MATSESKSAVNVPDERVNVALHFNSSEEGSNEVFSNLYTKLYDKNGLRKKKRTIRDPDDFHCYKGNVTGEPYLIYFNLTDFRKHPDKVIVKAELFVELTTPPSKPPFILSLVDAGKKTKLAQVDVLPGVTEQWIVFPMRSTVYRWLRLSKSIHAVQLVMEGKIDGVRFPIGEERGVFRLPLLVIYLVRVPMENHPHAERGRRSKEKPPPEEDMCSRRDLHVDTRQVLGDRVVFPVVYNAYICTGKCESPHKGHHQRLFTNHALVQYHMQVNNSANFICVPFSYSSLAVFQYVDQRKTHIVTRTFPEMIVSECKCAVVKEKFEN